MAAKLQARGRVRNIDGTPIKGQDGTVTISWFGTNRDGSSDPILWFQPRRYETTHVVVDANRCGADIILSWKEVKRLKLRQQFTGAIYRPPTPKSDPDNEKYKDYEKRRAENAAARKAARDQKPTQSPSSSARNAKKSGK
ncbi:G2/mitotic-specific cyclin-B3 [Lasiodiplodia theobromae]|uniref:G2/mitotic-specific cyclin-B3 n=1 Tax=Lasiodiplodia theobromae TaxID=45133 RepID=UPI0015C38A71|nr:G2/mitotic-specific cyclin-B3 [Lasiodiplodia theobromae]KAF4539160.1 G2/mitotic-specific cyclin-B3 [Lasiodiplodia theobromae]